MVVASTVTAAIIKRIGDPPNYTPRLIDTTAARLFRARVRQSPDVLWSGLVQLGMVPEKPSRAFIGISELSFHGENFEPAYVRHVRFGSKADMCSAKRHVRFTPNSDIDCVFRPLWARSRHSLIHSISSSARCWR